MKKYIFILLTLILTGSLFVGCAGTDVVLKYSPGSFSSLVDVTPELIQDNTRTDHYYYLSADGETTLKISHDYDLTGSNDIMIETPLAPFLDAGLDVSKLGEGYQATDNQFYLTADYGTGTGKKDNVTDSLFESVTSDRGMLTYHQDLDHYGIKLLNGKFEFAKDYKLNDKDIVFVLAAKPLAEIGVDVKQIDGWLFQTMKDTDGSDIDVLLKPYDLK